MQPFFIFNDINSIDMDIIVNKLPSIVKPEKDIEKIEIQGRNGFLTQDFGSYKSIVKPVECTIKNIDKINEISTWLNGSGEVIFSNEEDKIYKATIINQIPFSRILRQVHSFLVQFDCQPLKGTTNDYNIFKLCEVSVSRNSLALNPLQLYNFTGGTVFNANEVVEINKNTEFTYVNSGTMESEPKLKLVGTGDITLTINGRSFSIINLNGGITIDTELQDAYNDTELLNNKMVGEFPYFDMGENVTDYTGKLTSLEITPNTKFI